MKPMTHQQLTQETHEALLKYMGVVFDESPKGYHCSIHNIGDVARHIDDARTTIAPKSKKKELISEATIERFILEKDGERRKTTLGLIYAYLAHDGIFIRDESIPTKRRISDKLTDAMFGFFGVEQEEEDQCKNNYSGTYTFYANSEDKKDAARPYVVRGAIRFYHDPANNALAVEERQESMAMKERPDPPDPDEKPLVEIFEGTFFLKLGRLIAMLRSKKTNIPKFYILRVRPGSSRYPT
jgi:hypothetical protein